MLFLLGDIIGRPGRRALEKFLPGLIKKYSPAMVIANGENTAGGRGVTEEIGKDLFLHVDVMTSGNHIWDKKDALPYLEREPRLLRPANYPPVNPGRFSYVFQAADGVKAAVLNLQGRVFMEPLDCPFKRADEEVAALRAVTRSSSSISTPRRPPRSKPWAGTSTAGSRPSSAPTPTSRPPTSGSCLRARPTLPTPAWPGAATP